MNDQRCADALAAHVQAYRGAQHRVASADTAQDRRLYRQLTGLILEADTYAWSPETTAAVLAAARTVPDDATIAKPSALPGADGLFWFGDGLPITHLVESVYGIVWGSVFEDTRPASGIMIADLCHRPDLSPRVIPSGLLTIWEFGTTIATMLDRARRGPEPQLYSKDDEIRHLREVLQMIAAACAWLAQGIVIAPEEPVERHARKRAARELDRNVSGVRVVQLRREIRDAAHEGAGPQGTEYSHRWIVSGHWRQQACGEGLIDHRLIFVSPYIKGPADKPLKLRPTVYEVTR